MHFDREIYFDLVRASLFGGAMTSGQVSGQEAILLGWETQPRSDDLRWLAYCLATTKHETANEMQPIEEYGKGSGQPYGIPDAETGQTYYGRGYVQLTWRDNYARATEELELTGDADIEMFADGALDPAIAAEVMFQGMTEGWFRSPNKLGLYFSESADDAYGAREIVNGDKHIIPSWSGGVSIGKLIAGYHQHFLSALQESSSAQSAPVTEIVIKMQSGKIVSLTINGEQLL